MSRRVLDLRQKISEECRTAFHPGCASSGQPRAKQTKSKPTFEQVDALLAYDPDTGILRWKKASARQPHRVGQVAGYKRPQRDGQHYIALTIGSLHFDAHRIAWLLMTGEWPTGEVDHRNMIKNDNRWENLRLATRSQNSANTPPRCASGVKGVRWHQKTKKWYASIFIDGKQKSLGYYHDINNAAAAYADAAREKYGEFARL